MSKKTIFEFPLEVLLTHPFCMAQPVQKEVQLCETEPGHVARPVHHS